MKVLIRVYVSNGDKSNKTVSTVEEGFKALGKIESDVSTRVNWLHYTDIFFRDTYDYLRVNNNL